MRRVLVISLLACTPFRLLAAQYLAPDALRADVAAVSPDPFAFAPPGPAAGPPALSGTSAPANAPQLSLLKPYLVTVEGAGVPAATPLTVAPPNPFLKDTVPDAPPPAVPADRAADWRQPWEVTVSGDAWSALSEAWARDAVAVRRSFRERAGVDWPLAEGGPRAETARLAAFAWVRNTWAGAVRDRLTAEKSSLGLRGPVLVRGDLDATLWVLRSGPNNPAPVLDPRVTGDAAICRYGVGFLVRLCADLSERIPVPVLDLSSLEARDAAWGPAWIDESVRQGVAGLTVRPPRNPLARHAVEKALAPLSGPNVYLPPAPEAGIVVSLETAALEPGAWVECFRTYAAMRETGLWPGFVSDEQIAAGATLARYRVLVVPAAKWCRPAVLAALAEFRRLGGTVLVTDAAAFTRSSGGADLSDEGRRLFPERVTLDAARWRIEAHSLGLPSRSWQAAVTAATVGKITGRYTIPPPAGKR